MTRRLVLSILVAGAAAVWPAAAFAIDNTSSTDGVPPSVVAGNPADCTAAGISGATTLESGPGSGTVTDSNGASIVVTSDGTTFSFSATLPGGQMILGVLAKGGSEGGNLYDYRSQTAGGVLSDGNLHPPPTGNGGQFAGISHILFCYGTPTPPTPPPSGGGGGGTTPPPSGGTTPPPSGTTPPPSGTTPPPSGTTSGTTTTTSPTSAVKSAKKKKHKKHKKHHAKAKKLSRPPRVSSGFTG